MRRVLTPLLAIAAIAIPIAGCGSDDNSTSSTPAASTPSDTATGTSATGTGGASTSGGSGETVKIVLKNTAFDPSSESVPVGTKIEWVNEDGFAHDVTATSGEDFKSGTLEAGKTFEYTVDKPGTIDYVCTIHPGMQATLTVTG